MDVAICSISRDSSLAHLNVDSVAIMLVPLGEPCLVILLCKSDMSLWVNFIIEDSGTRPSFKPIKIELWQSSSTKTLSCWQGMEEKIDRFAA